MSEKKQSCKPCPDGHVRDKAGKCVMPDVTFAGLVLSLNTTALLHLGELAHPETGEKNIALDLARSAIDTLALLQKKTRGNLDREEDELLTRVLYELKMRFVKVAGESS